MPAEPPILLGAWRSRRWIERAAESCDGWLASGIHSSWEDLERGIGIYRAAGGGRAAVANVSIRSEERRVGKECGSTCRSRWSPDHSKKKQENKKTINRYT